MPWFNVDDGFANSKPVFKIPRRYRCAAIGLWTLTGSWSAKELTNGFISDDALEEFAGTVAMANWLVRAGLWKRVEGGWQFENWSKWQKTKEQVLAYRLREAEKKRAQRSSQENAGQETVSPGDTLRTETRVPGGLPRESRLCPGQPLPTPEPSSTKLGGYVTTGDDPEPPRYCSEHPEDTSDPCMPCAAARKGHDAWRQRQDARAEADQLEAQRQKRVRENRRKACLQCDDDGWRHDDHSVKCRAHEAAAHA